MWLVGALLLWASAARCAGDSGASGALAPAFVTTLGIHGPLSPLNELPPASFLNVSGSTLLTLTPTLPDGGGNQNYSVEFILSQSGLDDITEYHIHSGDASSLGPIVLHFQKNSSSLQQFNLQGFAQGTVSVTAGEVQPMIHTPQNFYVNVHTTAYPEGACRAQLMFESSVPYIYPDIPTYAFVLIAVGAFGTVLLLLLLIMLLLHRKAIPRSTSFSLEVLSHFVQPLRLPQVKKSTKNFSSDSVLGEGGYGIVYKGVPPPNLARGGGEEGLWAVKRAKSRSLTGQEAFRNEVRVISKLSHSNLVRLLAFCDDSGEEILVYEYMANGTLREALKRGVKGGFTRGSSKSPSRPLTFSERLRISLGAAQGLDYLHTFAKPAIIHRDVKSDNILLDEALEAKVADFGLLKSSTVDGNVEATQVAGTPGYMDPEYFTTYKVSAKSDVYSFGVVLLEILTGRPAIYQDKADDSDELVAVALVAWANTSLFPDTDISTCVDPKLGTDYDEFAARQMFEKAKQCIARDSKDRPTMSEVVAFLNAVKNDLEREATGIRRSWDASQYGTGNGNMSMMGRFGVMGFPNQQMGVQMALPDSIDTSQQTLSTLEKSKSSLTSFKFVSETMERGR